jgi:hypothetical protein
MNNLIEGNSRRQPPDIEDEDEAFYQRVALIERLLDPLPICVIVLIGAGNDIHGNGLPSFGEALLFFPCPFDPRLCRRRVLLPFLPSL